MGRKFYLTVTALIISLSAAFAQTGNKSKEKAVEITDSIPLLVDPNARNVFWGKVFDQTIIEPLVGVQLLIENTKTGTFTDNNGLFYLAIPDSIMKQDSLKVIIKSNGFLQDTIKIGTNKIPKNKEYFMRTEASKSGLQIKTEPHFGDPIYNKRK